MTKSIQIKGMELGGGIPKICVPLTSAVQSALFAEAERIKEAGPDLVEWRADYYEDLTDTVKLEETLRHLSEILDEIPLLFTIRTIAEGGQGNLEIADYVRINEQVAKTRLADLIDVEVFQHEEEKRALIRTIRSEGIICVGSSHDFTQTAPYEMLLERFRGIEASGADVLKLAVMPKTFEDVTALMNATHAMAADTTRPIISMSMSSLGSVTRISGGFYGSALTFATVTASSAPGQLPLSVLRPLLQLLHTT